MGSTVGIALNNIMNPLLNTTVNKLTYSKWAKEGISTATIATGVAIIHFYKSLGPSIACSTIASQLMPVKSILEAFGGKKVLGNLVPNMKTPDITVKDTDVTVIQSVLVYMGVVLQMGNREIPQALKIFLAPLRVAESMLKQLAQ